MVEKRQTSLEELPDLIDEPSEEALKRKMSGNELEGFKNDSRLNFYEY